MNTSTQSKDYLLSVPAEVINMVAHSLSDRAVLLHDTLEHASGTIDAAEVQAEVDRIKTSLDLIREQCQQHIKNNRIRMSGPLPGQTLRELVADNDQLHGAISNCDLSIS